MVEAAGLEVERLKRVRIGGLRLPRELPLGHYWRLGPRELEVGWPLKRRDEPQQELAEKFL